LEERLSLLKGVVGKLGLAKKGFWWHGHIVNN